MILTALQETQIELEATRRTLADLRDEVAKGLVEKVGNSLLLDVTRLNWVCDIFATAEMDYAAAEAEVTVFEREYAAQKKHGKCDRLAVRAAIDVAIASRSNGGVRPSGDRKGNAQR